MYGSNFADQCCRSGRRKDLRTLGAGTFVRGCTILTAIVWFLCALLTVVREIKGLVICNVIILPVSYFGAYLLIQQYGMQGGSISLAVSYLIEIGALWFWLLRKIKQREKQHMEQ